MKDMSSNRFFKCNNCRYSRSNQNICEKCVECNYFEVPKVNWWKKLLNKIPQHKRKIEWVTPQIPEHHAVKVGDIAIVSLPVKVLFEWSNEIIDDYDDETNTITEYKSGYIMKVFPNQKFIYKDNPIIYLGQSY